MVNREIKARKRAVKEEKEEIDGEIVRIRKGHPRTNLPVKLPENPTWLKQPNVVTLMAGDFKTVQIRILIAVIEKLQDVIELSIQHLDKYGTSIPCEQLSLFQEYSDRIRVDIAYRDLGVNPDQYKEVKSMVRKLISIPVELDVKDPITGEDSWSITGLFTKANIAINKEYIEIQKYAFRKYKIKTIENKHTHLVPEELERLENLILSGRYVKLQKSLDAFLFCCYAGMRYSDFINLSSENFVDINQETWLIYKSVKTGTEVRLPLYLLFSGKGIAILNKYRDNLEDFFHLRDNSNVNKDLIIITRLAGLSKRISFHTARHTNATLLIYNGINITTVQKLLGHKSVKTTQVYTNVMDMTIIHDLEKMK